MTTTEGVLLADHTTLHLGGPAARFIAAASEEDLVAAVRAADRAAEPVLVLGGGSNLVVADAGFPGTVVLAAFAGFEVAGSGDGPVPTSPLVEVTAAAGQDWDELVQQCVTAGLSGVECVRNPWLAGPHRSRTSARTARRSHRPSSGPRLRPAARRGRRAVRS